MKYTSTHRLLNTVLFGILAAGFAALVVFFTFFWAPNSIEDHYLSSVSFIDNGKSFAFNINLGTFFLALTIVAVVGLVLSIKSVINGKDDQLVVDSYLCFVGMGYIAAVFFFLNAIWLYNLIGNGENTFWIILCILGLIASLIASNVPMMKLLEDDKTNRLSSVVAGSFFSVSAATFVNVGYSWIFVIMSSYSNEYKGKYLGHTAIAAFVAAVLVGIAYVSYKKNKVKLANYLTYGSLFTFAIIPLYSGIKELVLEDAGKDKISLMNTSADFAGTKYCVFAIITGGLIVLTAIGLAVYNVVSDKKSK